MTIRVTEHAAEFAEVDGVWQPKHKKDLFLQMMEGELYVN